VASGVHHQIEVSVICQGKFSDKNTYQEVQPWFVEMMEEVLLDVAPAISE